MQDLTSNASTDHPPVAALSSPGSRPINEDLVFVDPDKGVLFVADGSGGPGKGDVASAKILECIQKLGAGPDALQQANARIFDAAQADPALKGMGATAALAVIQGDRAQLYHVGEVRAYLVRGGHVTQLTEDHTLATQLVKTKQITPEAAATHPGRKAILRYLGKANTVVLDHQEVALEPGDLLLVCTDGFYTHLALESLVSMAEKAPDQAALSEWLAEAMAMVGSSADDNLSAAIYSVPAVADDDAFYQHFIEKSIDHPDVDSSLRDVLRQMVHVAKADRAFISLFNEDGQPIRSIVHHHEGDPQVLFPHSRTVVQQMLARKETIWVTDAKTDPRMAASKSVISLEVGTIIAFPLILGTQLLGLIYLDRRSISNYTPKEIKELEGLTVCAKFVISNNESHRDLKSRLQKFQIINDVSLAINATIKLEQLLSLIIHHSLALSGGDQGYILLGNSEDNLECLASRSETGKPIAELHISRSIVNRCLEENRSICILDTQDGGEFQTKSVMAFDLRSVMCIPLSANQERLGVLYISSNAITKTFSNQDQALLESIAVQAALTIRNAQLLREQERQILQLEEALEKYRKAEHEASTDMLTGLHNRRYFEDQAARHIALCKRHNRALSLIMLDVDHFKKFNDTYGHAIGDEVLRVMGSVLPPSVRLSDIAARFGGEEFVVLCPDTDAQGAAIVAERIRQAVAEVQLLDAEGKPVRQITASLGIASLQVSDEDIADVMERADTALYACKANGRNQAQIWHAQMLSPEELKKKEHAGH